MSRRFQGEWLWLVSILLVALVVRLGAAYWWQARHAERFAFGDSESYWQLGGQIARGEPYQYGAAEARVFRTPGYPATLAALFVFTGTDVSVFWARAMGAVLGTATVAGIYILARLLFERRAALMAAGLTAVYPGAIALSVFVLSEALFCPLMVAQFILWSFCWRAESRKTAAVMALATGLCAGAATLVRPSWLIFTPAAITFGIVLGPHRSRHIVLGALTVLGFMLAMAPWWIRNANITGRFVPTTLQVGASLYDGLNPNADGSSNMAFVAHYARQVGRSRVGDVPPSLEYELDQRLRDEAITWARQNPLQVGRLAARKFVRLWNVWPNEPRFRGVLLRAIVLLTYLPAVILGILGAWRLAGRQWPHALCWLPAVYFTLLHVIFVSSIRYREPAMLGLLVLASAFVINVWVPTPTKAAHLAPSPD